MDINQLRYFSKLAQCEHMSMTADLLGISQPALSKSISHLEKEIGAELFDRQGNHIRLNRNGQEFVQHVNRILLDLDSAKKALNQSKYDFRGHIRIACRAFNDGIIDCITDYMNLNPKVQVSVYQTQRGDDNYADGIDFMLAGTNHEDKLNQEWISQPLYREEFYLLVSPRYREYPPEITSLSPADLKNDIFVSDFIVSETFASVDLLHRVCLSAGFKPQICFFTDDFNCKVHLVDEGKGITVLPQSCLRLAKRLAPDVRTFRIDDFDSTRTVSLLRRKDNRLSEAAMDFWDFVADYYSVHEK